MCFSSEKVGPHVRSKVVKEVIDECCWLGDNVIPPLLVVNVLGHKRRWRSTRNGLLLHDNHYAGHDSGTWSIGYNGSVPVMHTHDSGGGTFCNAQGEICRRKRQNNAISGHTVNRRKCRACSVKRGSTRCTCTHIRSVEYSVARR